MPVTTFKTSRVLRDRLNQHLRKSGYGLKRKSAWICEAIAQMLEHDKGLSAFGLGADLITIDTQDKVNLSVEGRQALDAAITKIRQQSPLREGVQSEIIRSAIRWRLGEEGKNGPGVRRLKK